MTQSLPPRSTQAQLGEITELARMGDQQAFTRLFEYYHGPICSYLAHLVGNDEVGRDLAQETFIRAWKGLPKLHGYVSFRPWLYRIATNVARTHRQQERLMRWLPWRLSPAQASTLSRRCTRNQRNSSRSTLPITLA